MLRPKDEGQRWVAMSLAMLAIWVGLYVTMAVIPSFWLYFADGTLKWTGEFTIGLGVRELVLPMQALRDVVVVIWYGIMLLAAAKLISMYNKRNTKTLPSDESKREATGGYK